VADIFVSYTGSDRDWAFWIAKELEALGHRPRVHEWEINSGDDIYAWMEQRHDTADHVLCVISDEYLNAPYSKLERNAALWQAAGKRPGFVLFVAVNPCRLPTLSDHIRRCELFGMPEDVARLRFRDFMRKRESLAAVAFPGKVFAVSNIPIRVPKHFLGREDSLAAIEAALGRYEGRVAITALHGLRGVGKTTLAAAYADRHRGDYRATWWIRAQAESSMRADLVGLGARLGWVAADEKEEPALGAVMERLRHEGEGVLLIYDNAPDADALRHYLPRGGSGRVLVTSNAHAWRGVAEPVEIRLWPKEVGADYFVARTGRNTERAAAELLSDALGGLPLAHEQAAAYCERLEISVADYRERFEATPAKMLDSDRDAPAEYHDRLTVAKTFSLAIDEAAKLHPAAEPLIAFATLLASEPIPLFLFAEAREKFGEPLASALAGDGLDEATAALRSFALIDREMIADERVPSITTDCIRLHRLVRQVAQARHTSASREQALCALIAAVAAVYPKEVGSDPKKWRRARRLDRLALELVAGDGSPPTGAETLAADLLNSLGEYRIAIATYAEARRLTERALAICEKVLDREHTDTATCLNNLALLLQVQGDLAGARPLFGRALAIREKALGPEHPHTVLILNNLASLLVNQGDFAGARPLLERALAIREKVLGPEHPDTATSLNNLAALLLNQGDLSGARPPFELALAIREKVLGPEHPDTATSLNNLACVLRDSGRSRESEPLFQRAIDIGEKILGSDHPDVVTRWSNLACMLRDSGRATEAEPLFRRAIAIGDKTLGTEHPLACRFRSHYARLLLMTDRAVEAMALGKAALATHERINGPNHPWTKDSVCVTADALDALGRTDEAAALREHYRIDDGSNSNQ